MMRLEQFIYLQKLGVEKSINTASKKMHLTPQALSQAIKSLEDELGMGLIRRSHHGVSLTNQGAKVVEAARRFQEELQMIQGAFLEEYLDIAGEITIHAQYGTHHLLSTVLVELYKHTTDLDISVEEGSYIKMVEAVLSQEAEIALLAVILFQGSNIYEFDEKTLFFRALFEYKWFCKVNKDSLLAKYKTISMSTILEYPVMVFGDDQRYSNVSMIRCLGEPRKVIFVQHENIMEEMVAAGVGVCLGIYRTDEDIPESLNEKIVHIKVSDDLKLILGYVAQKNVNFSKEAVTIINVLEQGE